MRRETPTPCSGSNDSAFKIRRSSVPRRRSVLLSAMVSSYRNTIADTEMFKGICDGQKKQEPALRYRATGGQPRRLQMSSLARFCDSEKLVKFESGGREGIRTLDLLVANEGKSKL